MKKDTAVIKMLESGDVEGITLTNEVDGMVRVRWEDGSRTQENVSDLV